MLQHSLPKAAGPQKPPGAQAVPAAPLPLPRRGGTCLQISALPASGSGVLQSDAGGSGRGQAPGGAGRQAACPRHRPLCSPARLCGCSRTTSRVLRGGTGAAVKAELCPEPSVRHWDSRRCLYFSQLGGGGRGGGGPFFLGPPGASSLARRRSLRLRPRGLEGSRLRWLSEKALPRSGRGRGSGGLSGERARRSPSHETSCVDVAR